MEFLLEEKDKLEHELHIAVLDLSNIRALNEAAMLDNIQHDENLAKHEKVFEDLKRELPLELDLINLERSCFVNKFEFDLEINSIVNRLLSAHVNSLHEVVDETAVLKDKIAKIQLGMQTSQQEHIEEMHSMNKELLKKRQAFEESFRSAVNRAYTAHLEKAQLELSEEEVTHLNERANILNELDIQNKGVKCLRDAITGHEEELVKLTSRISALHKEANVIRSQIHVICPKTTMEPKIPFRTPKSTVSTLTKLNPLASNPRRRLSQSLGSLIADNNRADEKSFVEAKDEEERRLLEWRRNELGNLLEEIRALKVMGRIKNEIIPPPFSKGVDAFRRLKTLATNDSEFSDVIHPLLRHISLIATADEFTSIEDNVVGWLAYKVFGKFPLFLIP